MDPYLEGDQFWPEFQRSLVEAIKELVRPGLPSVYEARVGERVYSVEADDSPVRECREPFAEILRKDNGQLITLIEVVSPTNKTTSAGRDAYWAKRQESLSQKSGIVEVDLVRCGTPTLNYSREGLPEFDYGVTVTRSSAPDRYEIYTSTLEKKRLPKFKVPLAPNERDLLLDLQAVFEVVYERGRFGERIDYERNPSIPLPQSRAAWVDSLLREKGLRREPTEDQIAVAAYFLWQNEGCPAERAEEHWHRAREQLLASRAARQS
jgi:hypothetical protein